ncbi:replication initiation protein [Clostridium tarantellae]|uniref:RepB family plasmid replication initiator protein n=1 Tax=Clostridium tarantellae TaxID=39493 RepID=A0A6I1MV91_9CLOT|nr:replication initiation protein [Clostridium tarantellae]MPQ44761.1 RepB family plasmid replication initiator protein [Clostridium tarantellae]
MDKEILFKSNDIIMANSNIVLKSNEYKLFNKIMYSCQKINNKKERLAIITFDEIKDIFQHSNECSVKNIETLLENWRTVSIKYNTPKYSSGTGLLNNWERDKSNDEFYLYIKDDFYKILMNYKEFGYSPIDVKMVRQAKGYYTQRLYELLRMWSGSKKEVTYTIDELKEFFKVENKYKLYADFKNRILQPSIKEIEKKLNMNISFIENKKGKKTISITFFVIDHEPRHYNFKNINNDGNKLLKEQVVIEDTAKEVTTNAPVVDVEKIVSSAIMKAIKELQINKIKISAKTLERNLNTYGEDIFNRAINILIGKKEEGEKITAPVKFLNGILENLKTKSEIAATKAENENTKTLNFTNYSQREYDYDSLEKQLLGWEK